MIAQLTGRVAQRQATSCVIEVNGVGYLVGASTRTLAALPDHATILTEMQVREDAITLFGFIDSEERDWFRLLTTVQGVGGRVALAILSILSPPDLAAAIAAGDKAALNRAAGVGPKLALRLATELRDKIAAIPASHPTLATPPPGNAAAEAVSALANLGYRRAEADAAVNRAKARLSEDAGFETLLREALKELTR